MENDYQEISRFWSGELACLQRQGKPKLWSAAGWHAEAMELLRPTKLPGKVDKEKLQSKGACPVDC